MISTQREEVAEKRKEDDLNWSGWIFNVVVNRISILMLGYDSLRSSNARKVFVVIKSHLKNPCQSVITVPSVANFNRSAFLCHFGALRQR